MNRTEIVREIASDLRVRARVIGLKRLAQETTELYDELIRCKTPPGIAPAISSSTICACGTTNNARPAVQTRLSARPERASTNGYPPALEWAG